MRTKDDAARRAVVTSAPVVMAPRSDGFEVVWGVSRLARGVLEWRRLDDAGLAVESGVARAGAFGMVPQGDRVLRVRMSGFAPGDLVEVRTITDAIARPGSHHESAWKRVRVLDPTAAEARIAVWNDTHQHAATLRALDAATPAVDLLVWNGDLCNDWTDDDSFTATVLDPEGLDITAGRPLTIVVGNHDVRGTWAYRLEEYVATPEGRPYSAFRVGPIACVVLHTGEDKPDDHPTFEGRVAFEPLRALQAEWLREATARPEIRDAPYRLVFCHIPLRWTDESPVDYERGGYDWYSRMSRDAWHDALVAWGAQLIVSGHTHEPALLDATPAFPYGQLVAGGPDRDPASPEAATWTEAVADASGLVVTSRDLDGGIVLQTRLSPLA